MNPNTKRAPDKSRIAKALEQHIDDLSRRVFLKRAAGAGMALGLPGMLAACGGGAHQGAGKTTAHTLFYNLAHENHAATDHYLHVAGKKFRLDKVHEKPEVLANARKNNAFLRNLPNQHITHHLENVELPADTVMLAYVTSNENPQTGTWSMSLLHFIVPATAHAQAFAATPAGPLPLSAKRRSYGMGAAQGAHELLEETMLVDSHDHALALIGLHPDLLCLDPAGASYIHHQHIAPDANTQFLAGMLISQGPATVQQNAGQPNVSGWATLVPLLDQTQNPPRPMKMSDGVNNLYYPDWNPQVDNLVGAAIGAIHMPVKNDENLGADITAASAGVVLPEQQLRGKVWARHDGLASVDQGSGNPALAADSDTSLAWTFTHKSVETGLVVNQPKVELQDGKVEVTLDNVNNWFLRWLGIWVQFIAPDGQPIPSATLDSDTLESRPGPYPSALDKDQALFAGMLPQAMAMMGVPLNAGHAAPVIRIPDQAATMRVMYAGLGFNPGFDLQPGTLAPIQITPPGIGMTLVANYGLVTLFMAAGVQDMPESLRFIITLVGEGFAEAVMEVIGESALSHENVQALPIILDFLKQLLQGALAEPVLVKLALYIATAIGTSQAIDCIPVVGQVARAVAAAIGALELAETSLEIALSPSIYAFDLVLTHDLAVSVRPDPQAASFPAVPAGYSMYYKVSYLFDNGTAHVLDAVTLSDPGAASIPIVFKGIPRGGKVNIMIGLYMRHASTAPGQNDWCAAQGSTGLVDNTVDNAPDLVLTNTKIPIQANTRYIHTSKSVLDANGQHQWQDDPNGSAAPPFVAPPNGQQPGLGGFRSITVRQATSQPARAGYVGYAWRAYSSGVLDCRAQAAGQLDLLANLNTDRGNGGANARNGYASSQCGLQAGGMLSYSLLGDDASNFYLDPDSLFIRPVNLAGAPSFDNPTAGRSVGRLNFDSTKLLLHPAGHVISINNAAHKIESLRLPPAPLDDATAAQRFLARTHAGPGTRPGLITAPSAAAISADGAILVLEDSQGNNRIQAFDLGGNPIPYFKQQKLPYFLTLDATRGATYLDLAVEFTGYLHVLARDRDNTHRLDIYHPGQSGTDPICTTTGVNAARLTVDLWRSVYTLNYETLRLPGGAIPALTEPSISLWVPPPPN